MNFESEKKSPAELRRQAETQMRIAQDTQTFVSLTEKNWQALLNIEQNFLAQMQVQEQTLHSLMTREDIARYLQTQENLMQEHLERLEETSAEFAKQAGRLSENFFLCRGAFSERSTGDSQNSAASDFRYAERVSTERQVDAAQSYGLRRGADGLVGLGAGLASLMDDESDDPDEIRARIEAENFGAAVGLIAGATIGLYERLRPDDELSEPEQDEPRWEQTM